MKKTLFIKNAAVLTVSAVVLRLLGTVFKVWVASLVGAKGMGLYSLITSVFVFVSSFAQSGISTAVTRLCTEAAIKGENPASVLKKSILLTEIIAFASSGALFFLAPALSRLIVGNTGAAGALRILCAALPVIGICSCFRGYFIAVRHAAPCASSQIAEQAARIVISFLLVSKFARFGISAACACLVLGDTAAEICCCLYLWARYKNYIKKHTFGLHKTKAAYRKIIRIALPITAGRYLGSLLRTAENILIPKRLAKSGVGKDGGLSLFGSIKAMALPVILFPCALLSSVSLLLIPEISAAKCKNQNGVVRDITNTIIKLTVIFSCISAALFAAAGREMGNLLYKSENVGFLLCALSPIVPLMYLDSVCDGILKGLDCQNFCFFVGIADSFMRVVLILLTLHKFGFIAFIIIMYVSNFLTAALNTGKLIKESGARIDVTKSVFIPLICALTVTKAAAYCLKQFAALNDLSYIVLLCPISVCFYTALLFLFGSLKRDDIAAVISK